MMPLASRAEQYLSELADQSLLRKRVPADDIASAQNFSSNDYLGLAASEPVHAKRSGSGASQHISGYSQLQEQLELSLAQWLGYEAVCVFSTGYMANLGVMQALFTKQDALIADKFNHASLIDAIACHGAKSLRYPHLDKSVLRARVASASSYHDMAAVVTDGVFSMDGDFADYLLLNTLREQNSNLVTYIDDAHGLGCMGEAGRGSWAMGGRIHKPDILVGTFGKAFGCFGAFVAADRAVVECVIQKARTLIYTTALPPAVLATNLAHCQRIIAADDLRDKLQQNIAYFKAQCESFGVPLLPSHSAIQPVPVGNNQSVLALGEQLKQQGFHVGVIRPPTVPRNSARLRITLSAAHELGDIKALVEALKKEHQALEAAA